MSEQYAIDPFYEAVLKSTNVIIPSNLERLIHERSEVAKLYMAEISEENKMMLKENWKHLNNLIKNALMIY